MTGRKRHEYTKRLRFKKVGTGVEYISDEPVKRGRVIVLTNIAVEDETSELTYVRIGKRISGYFHSWEEQKTPAAAALTFDDGEWWIRESEYFQAELSGGQADDVCFAYLDGYWFEWPENPRS